MWYFAQFGDGTRNGDGNAGQHKEPPQVICRKN